MSLNPVPHKAYHVLWSRISTVPWVRVFKLLDNLTEMEGFIVNKKKLIKLMINHMVLKKLFKI